MPGFNFLMNNRVIALIARFLLAGIFIASGLTKLMEPREEFIALVKSFAVLPEPAAVVYATLLPWVELVTGALLLFGLFVRQSAVVVNLMLFSFVIAIAVVFLRDGSLTNCGCFGSFSNQDSAAVLIARDGIFMLLATLLMYGKVRPFSMDKRLF
ncbi:MAG: MauE/DoxX family redox-associated membrane protein [Patescibacteria group bacterium]